MKRSSPFDKLREYNISVAEPSVIELVEMVEVTKKEESWHVYLYWKMINCLMKL